MQDKLRRNFQVKFHLQFQSQNPADFSGVVTIKCRLYLVLWIYVYILSIRDKHCLLACHFTSTFFLQFLIFFSPQASFFTLDLFDSLWSSLRKNMELEGASWINKSSLLLLQATISYPFYKLIKVHLKTSWTVSPITAFGKLEG